MIVSINQPAYLPWLGYFHRIAQSDLHIVLDHVQLEKNSFANRNRIRSRTGWQWLTVPIKTKGRFGELAINQVELADDRWRHRHWESLRQTYGRAPCFRSMGDFLEALYHQEWARLMDLAMATIRPQLEALAIGTPLVFSSQLGVSGAKDELVLNLLDAVGAKTYLSGPFGRTYLNEAKFQERGIVLRYHDFQHPVYPQQLPGFEPNMAALDLLLNCGPQAAREILGIRDQEVPRHADILSSKGERQ